MFLFSELQFAPIHTISPYQQAARFYSQVTPRSLLCRQTLVEVEILHCP